MFHYWFLIVHMIRILSICETKILTCIVHIVVYSSVRQSFEAPCVRDSLQVSATWKKTRQECRTTHIPPFLAIDSHNW
jgi:hypothetical protein